MRERDGEGGRERKKSRVHGQGTIEGEKKARGIGIEKLRVGIS